MAPGQQAPRLLATFASYWRDRKNASNMGKGDVTRPFNHPIQTMKNPIRLITPLLATTCLFAGAACQRKEKVLDIKTPGGGIEVERDKKSGEVDIKVEEKK